MMHALYSFIIYLNTIKTFSTEFDIAKRNNVNNSISDFERIQNLNHYFPLKNSKAYIFIVIKDMYSEIEIESYKN